VPELDHNIVKKNVISLIEYNKLTQAQFAEIAGMTQPNVSKSLHGDAHFSLDQIYRISQHFNKSIDHLLGNSVGNNINFGPTSILGNLIKLLLSGKIRTTKITVTETVYAEEIVDGKYSNKYQYPMDVEYDAFYFPSFTLPEDIAFTPHEQEKVHDELAQNGNLSPFYFMNQKLNSVLSFVSLYRNGDLNKELFTTIIKNIFDTIESEIEKAQHK